MDIRNATRDDLEAIRKIYNDAILNSTATFDTEIKSSEDRIKWFERLQPKYPIIVAESGNELLGWASVGPWSERKAYDGTVENSIYIRGSSRGLGTGSALFSELLKKTEAQGFHTMIARIAEANPVSVHLHEKFGFHHVGILKEVGMKFGKLLDVTLMQKVLL